MKLHKKMMALHLLASFLISGNAMAGIKPGVRKTSASSENGGSSGRQNPTGTKITEAQKDDFIEVKGNTTSCTLDADKETYFPLSFFNLITRDEDAKVEIENKSDNKVLVKIPPVINVCGQFTPEFRQDKKSKNVTILMKVYSTKDKKYLSHKEFEDCLKNEKILVDGSIDWKAVPSNAFSESLTSFDYDFDKKADAKKTVSITYGYPKSFNTEDGYKPLYGFDNSASVLGESCSMRAEMIADKKVYINEGTEVLLERINAICANGKAQEIAAARKSIGNAEALKDIAEKLMAELDVGYLAAVKIDVKDLDLKMKKIEDQLNREKDSLDEAGSKKLIAKYAEHVKDLNNIFLEPAITHLKGLMEKRAGIEDSDSPEIGKIDESIKKLNEDIGQFANRNPTSLNSVYSVMEKYAISDSAKVIDDIRLKSFVYSKVYAGRTDEKRGKPMTFDTAQKRHYNELKKFEKDLTDWEDVYLTGQGNTFPYKKTQKERQVAVDRAYARDAAFQKKENTDWNNYCARGWTGAVKNQVKCNEWERGFTKRRNAELKRIEQDRKIIENKNRKLAKMDSSYGEYQQQRKMASESEEESDEPSSLSGHEESFSERFTNYYGPNQPAAYNGSMYNMGGNAMQMGQQQSYQMPQMQMQQGQYQMPQQNVGW